MTKKLVRTVCDASGNDQWDEQLHLLSWAINSSVGRYKFSPEEMMYGRVSRRPIDPLWVDWTAKDEEEHMAHVKQNLDKIHAVVADLRQKHRQQEADRKNVTRQAKLFKEGDLVYVLSGLFTAPSGLLVKKLGPFLVEEISAHGQTALLRDLISNRVSKQHFTKLVHATEGRLHTKLNSFWDKPLKEMLQAQQRAVG